MPREGGEQRAGAVNVGLAVIKAVEEDRRLEPDLRLLLQRIRAKSWDLYA